LLVKTKGSVPIGLASPAGITTCGGAGAPPGGPPPSGFPPGLPSGVPPGFQFSARLMFAVIRSSVINPASVAGWVPVIALVWVIVWVAIVDGVRSA
jgi:hypothetical protein